MSRNYGRDNVGRRGNEPDVDLRLEVDEVVDASMLDNVDVTEGIEASPSDIPNALTFTTFPLAPVAVTYRIQTSRMAELFYRIMHNACKDVVEVFYNTDHRLGDVFWYCRFSDDCDHFTDPTFKHTALPDKKIKYVSPEIIQLASKYGINPPIDLKTDKDGRVLNRFFAKARIQYLPGGKARINKEIMFAPNFDEAGNEVPSRSLRLSWGTLMQIILDLNGSVFLKKYNVKPPKCTLDPVWTYSKAHGNQKFGDATLLTITKSAATTGFEKPRPRECFSDFSRE